MTTEYHIYQLIDSLTWGVFNRIGLLFISPVRFNETKKVRDSIKQATKDNEETDIYIRNYIKKAKSIVESEF